MADDKQEKVDKINAKELNSCEFIDIPAGEVLIGSQDNWHDNYIPKEKPIISNVPAFAIVKYPVSNAQFNKFVMDGGYHELVWWTQFGWEFIKRKSLTNPYYWKDSRFNEPEKPVVCTWYEAIAFCNWLQAKTSKPIELPTEEQWQRATQALPSGQDSKYLYPWGNEWDETKCNNNVSRQSNAITSDVMAYESKGNISPCGVVDLVGNTYEWCLNSYVTGSISIETDMIRSARGGSHIQIYPHLFHSTNRSFGKPNVISKVVGFRLACRK